MITFIKRVIFLPVFFCGVLSANEHTVKFTYRKDTQTLIPAYYEIKDKVTIAAPIGDVVLQSPIIKLKIEGQGPYIFMLDTGFSNTLISSSLAKKLNLTNVGKQKIRSVTPNQIVEVFQDIYLVDKIEIGQMVIRNYGIVSSSGFENKIQDLKALKVDGILSANVFYGLLLTFDYQKENIYIDRGDLLHDKKNNIQHLEKAPVPMIKAKVKFHKLKKQVEQDFILDTGFGSYFFVNSCKIPEMMNFPDRENLISLDYLGHENTKYFARLYGEIFFPPHVRVESPYITFGPVNCELKNPVGLIGRTFFEKNKVTLDQMNGLVRIEKY